MSSTVDPAKLKVVELRAELSARGLDSKGNKPVLVKRLKDALEKELQQELPDTSIADTSTEELNTSQGSQGDSEQEEKGDKEPQEAEKQSDEAAVPPVAEVDAEPAKEAMETEEIKPSVDDKQQQQPVQPPSAEEAPAEEKPVETTATAAEEENTPDEKQDSQPAEEPKKTVENGEAAQEEKDEPMQQENKEGEKQPVVEEKQEQRGDKRRHSSPSPERSSQRRRSRSPIKEDEPAIDSDKVQLSWYDSDLHLQVDKESFLSARPYHEGAFGYAWAGVRATHGITTGKVCFEVKITEELKWEDLIKPSERLARDEHHDHSKKDKKPTKPTDDEAKSSEKSDETPTENKPTSDESAEDKDETVEEKEKSAEQSETPTEESKEEASVEEKEEAAEADKEVVEEKTAEGDEQKTTTEEEKTENGDAAKEGAEEKPTEEEKMETEEVPEPIPTHLFRVGWSLPNTCLQLGEHKFSYGYESSGRFVTDKQFTDYGVKFGVGDVITSYIEITPENVTISYAVNGVLQGVAIEVARGDFPEEENFALFPHVLSRNYAFELNLGAREEPWFAAPPEGAADDYVFLERVEGRVAGPVRPQARGECEVIMMCGLPGAGKTHWVREWVEKNPEKRYTVIGNTQLLEKMTVNGAPLKSSYRGRWSVILDKLQKCLSKLVDSAALRRRNYVIDQTNIFPSAQRRKMRPFEGFKRRAVIVVVGDEEQAKRRALQEAEDGNDVPDTAILEMKANMSIPRTGEWLEEVEYVELGEDEARAVVQKYNKQGRDAGFGNLSYNQRRDYRNNRFNRFPPHRRNDFRSGGGGGGNYRDHRNYPPSRFDRGPRPWLPFRPGGWGRNDRRDSRGPPPPPPSRDWRNSGRSNDRSSERSRSQTSSGGSYNRSRSGSGGGGATSNTSSSVSGSSSRPPTASSWQQGGSSSSYSQPNSSWQTQSSAWGQQGQQAGGGGWNQGAWNGSQSQNQWKYGGGGGGGQQQGGYGQNYGYPNYYYGQYQNWGGSQGDASAQYGQYTQQSWMQYAQQYAQAQTNPSTNQTQK